MLMAMTGEMTQMVSAGLTMLYWEIERRIRQDVLEEKRAAHGKEIITALRRQLGWTHFKSLIPTEDPLKLLISEGATNKLVYRMAETR